MMKRFLRAALAALLLLSLASCANAAISATAVFDVRTGGSDTANGGAFNSGNASFPTDLTCTSGNTASPVVTSASYTFVAGDVGAWVFIQSGTNWNPGWYQIASVAGGNATLTAGAGAGYKYQGHGGAFVVTTLAGVATVATQSTNKAVWGVDYSQQNAAQLSFTDMTIGAAGATFTSAGHPVGKNFVGNHIQVTGGTNATAGIYEVISTSGTTATLDRNWASGASSNGAGGLGGGFATPGMAGSVKVAKSDIFIGSGTYTFTSSTQNVAGGILKDSTGGADASDTSCWTGYNTTRCKMNTDATRPLLQVPAAGVSTVSIFTVTALDTVVRNINIDGASKTSITCFEDQAQFGGTKWEHCKASNCTIGFKSVTTANAQPMWIFCEATSFSSFGFTSENPGTLQFQVFAYCCSAHDGTATGFNICGTLTRCLSYNNSGATSDGFAMGSGSNTATLCMLTDCISRNNGRHGYFFNGQQTRLCSFINCLSVVNAGYGFEAKGVEQDQVEIIVCADYNSTSGNYDTSDVVAVQGFISLTADPHTSSSNFNLNSTAGGGAALRAARAPGGLPNGIATDYGDVGGIQHQDSGGGSQIRRPEVRTGMIDNPFEFLNPRRPRPSRSLTLAP